jgi:carbon-monoxide dehydrogenase medium subunit
MLPEFELLTPRSLPEALGILAERNSDVMPLAGGTNVIVSLRGGAKAPTALMDLRSVTGIGGIHREDGHIVVGGACTIAELLSHPLIAEYGGPLKPAAAAFANPLVRNRATVGGNLIDASPAADMAPPLMALDAQIELSSAKGKRWLRVDDLIVGVRETVRQPDELLTAVRWPVPANCTCSYHKLGLRQADAVSVVSAAVVLRMDGGERCQSARIALGAVAPRPIRVLDAEALLCSAVLTPDSIAEASRLCASAARPIDDVRATAAYRRRVTSVIVRRLLAQAVSDRANMAGA